jgi:hypothetical protein
MLAEFSNYLNLAIALLTAVWALLPSFWRKSEAAQADRWLAFFTVLIVGALMWPRGLSRCMYWYWYAIAALVLLLICVAAYFRHRTIIDLYGYTQDRRDDTGKDPLLILGGPRLTQTALELRKRNPEFTIQDIFEKLDHDPRKTWEEGSRTRVRAVHRLLVWSVPVLLLLAVVAAAAATALPVRAAQLHTKLTLSPSTEVTLNEGRSLAIVARLQACNPKVHWDIEGNSQQKALGLLGEITQSGSYSAPLRIEQPLDLQIVVTPEEHDEELQKLTIHLRKHTDESTPHETPAQDDHGNTAQVVIEIVDDRYSWVYGDVILSGHVGGKSLVQRIAAAGTFNGYDDLICIGAASREYVDPALEENRARDRAALLAQWVHAGARLPRTSLRALKIGRYAAENRLASSDETAKERQVVIIGVHRNSADLDLMSALADAFRRLRNQHELFELYSAHYPRSQWEWVDPNRVVKRSPH